VADWRSGLPRRFPNEIQLEDYTAHELAQIGCKVAKEKFDLVWEAGLEERLADHIMQNHSKAEISQHNGGLAVNLVERALSTFAERVVNDTKAEPGTIRTMIAADFMIVGLADIVTEPEPEVAETGVDVDGVSTDQHLHEQLGEIRMRIDAQRCAVHEEKRLSPLEPSHQLEGARRTIDDRLVTLWGELSNVEDEIVQMQQLSHRERELEAAAAEQARREIAAQSTRTRTQAQVLAQQASTYQPSESAAVLANPLFANSGSARKIAFVIDVSGSMNEVEDGGETRIAVVRKHLAGALKAMAAAPDAEFGVATFNRFVQKPLGDKLLSTSADSVQRALDVIGGLCASSTSEGNADCLRNALQMRPHAIYFLGDGGWDPEPLVRAAQLAREQSVVIHSIAFFTTGGGLEEIAELTGGTFKEIHSMDGLL
jgi:hypothetical protein